MGARGEGIIQTKDGEISLLFTIRALLSAEKQLGKSIPDVLRSFMTNTLSYIDLVALLRSGMEAARMDARTGNRPISNNDAINVIDEVGYRAVCPIVMEAVATVISYKPDEELPVEDNSDPN
jgi:hypothetical protein